MLTAIASLCANKLVRARAEVKLRESHQDLERRIAERTAELVTTNERLKREIAERSRAEKVQRALYAISEAIHTVEDLPNLYQRIHEIIGTLMPAGNFYIAFYDPATDTVSFPYHRDEMDPPPASRKARRGMTEYVLRTGRAALVDLDEITRLKAAGEYVQSGAPAKIWLGVPLSSGGKPFGVMAVQDHHNERVYGEEEKQILSFVAGQTALAIERKRAENDLRVALAAEKELNQLKSSFVSMVSHEFRTPLGVILSSSNILDRYLDRLPPDKRTGQLRAIRKSVHRMNDLIDDVLMLGKLDAGVLSCQPVPLDLAAFCRRAAGEIESATARDGAIRFVESEVDGETAAADEGLLHHILTNILGNAVKYSPPGEPVEFNLSRRGPDAEFVIRDRGCGIPAADQARLFTAFYRGSNVGQKPGSGLGLVIAKRCVDLHGGLIRCESEEGKGTTFTVTLPLFDATRVFHRRANGTTSPFH
jgi:signal transduction histidine kinase